MSKRGVAVGVAVASSTYARSGRCVSGCDSHSQGNLSLLSSATTRSGGYVSAACVARLQESLSERDWTVVRDVARLRLVTGAQLERLHFAALAASSRSVVRRRVLGRLVRARVLATLERRIGGVRAGSSGLMYVLDIAGKRLMDMDGRVTRPGLPGERFVRHTLAVAELYVSLIEQARVRGTVLKGFQAEPASWWPDGLNGRLKPDAHVVVRNADHRDHWWCEVDLATEHLTTLARKLATYIDFYNRGQLGPEGAMPWVMISVPDDKRYSDVVRLIRQLPEEDQGVFSVALHNDAAQVIMRRLEQS